MWHNVDPSRRIPKASWDFVIETLSCTAHLDSTGLTRWRRLTEGLLRRKRLVATAGSSPGRDERALIAALVALPVLELGLDWYRGWTEILIYPGAFRQPYEYEDEAGVVHTTQRTLSGEAWDRGPMVLSLEDVLADVEEPIAGRNVVIHECAHKLDVQNGGDDNGFPPLHADMDAAAWTATFSGAYDDFCQRVAEDKPGRLDPYAAESPGEFFAVLSEVFFVAPQMLTDSYPPVYRELAAFYRQDPLRAVRRF